MNRLLAAALLSLLCAPLQERSLGARQPFQLPAPSLGQYEWLWGEALEHLPLNATLRGGWLSVDANPCASQRCLERLLGCRE